MLDAQWDVWFSLRRPAFGQENQGGAHFFMMVVVNGVAGYFASRCLAVSGKLVAFLSSVSGTECESRRIL